MAIPFTTGEIVTAAEMNEIARAHWRKTTAKQVVSSVTETDLLNGEVTIDAGAMSTNRLLRLTAWGDAVQNTGATQGSPRIKLKLGATSLLDTNVQPSVWTASATRLNWRIVAEICNLGAANSQWATLDGVFTGFFSSSVLAFNTGEGRNNYGIGEAYMLRGGNSGAVDTTAAQALALTVTLPTSSASLDVTLKAATIELV